MPDCGCNKKSCSAPAVLEITNKEAPVVFHKVMMPAAMGDDETNPPRNGQYRNVLLEYEANGHIWMFSSDGIPTFISNGRDQGTINYEELLNKPSINDVELIGDVSLDDLGITDLIDDEADAREEADTELQNAVDAEATTRSHADILLQDAIDAEVAAREEAISAEESARILADNDIISRIPVVNDATLTIQKNGSTVATFTANDADNVTADIAVPTKTSDITNDSGFITNTVNDLTNYYTKTESDTALTNEATTRADADTNLQEQIDAISSSSDVVDVVGTYAELQAYDTSRLGDNDIIKVLTDETHDDAISYYRWDATNEDFVYIGSQGPFYTKSETDAAFVPQTRTVNNKALSSNITLTAADVGALPDSTVIPTVNNATLTIQKNGATVQTFTANQATNTTANITVPTKTSDLTNDSDFPVDANYVHTDNNYTTADKNKLAGIAAGAEVNVQSDWNESDNSSDAYIKNKPSIPDSTSDLVNDSGFITNSVNNLTNYYKKSETYTKTEVDGLIPTKTSDLTNDGADGTSTYVEADDLATVATSGSYNDLSNKPNLAAVATSGSYNDLTNKPTIPAAQVNSDWNASSGVAQILNKPNLATVATSGSYNDLTDKPDISLVEMSYGESNAWAKFIAAYQAGKIVYCRASSNSNPATGTQGRKAFMAYVNNAENPTEVEFQYVRSVSSKTASQPVDQVFVYKLTSASGGTWTVTTRDMGPKLANGTNTTVSYSNGTYTVNASQPTVPTKTSDLTNDGSDGTSTYVEADDLATVATSGSYNDLADKPSIPSGQVQSDWAQTDTAEVDYIKNKPTIPTVGNATLTIQKNGTSAGTFTANATSNKTINITVPTTAADVSALPASTKYGASIAVSINTTDYKVTTTLKDQDGNTLGTAQVIDLPLESVVVSGSYDSTNKKIVLTLQNGNTIDIPVADLVAGLQSEITSTNKLSSDLVDDTNHTHKFVTAAQITKLNGIAAGAEVNVQSDWNQTTTTADDYIKNKPSLATVATSGSYNDLSNKPTIPTVNNATLTIQKNGSTVKTFTANASSNVTANITVPTKTSDLTNDSNFTTTTDLAAKVDVASINITGQTTTILAQVQALAGTKNYARFICTSDGGSANISDNPNPGKGFVCVAYQSRGSSSSDYAYEVICYSNDGASKPYHARVIHSTSSITWKRLQDVAFSGSYNDLSNKPTIPAAQVNSDWNATSGKAQILNKPTLATVATSGSYNDLSNKPTIPAAQVQSNWTQTTTTAVDYIKNKPTLATVATSGSYNDLSNKPTIPTVNNATLTIQKNGSTVKTFTANASSNVTANITVPTKTSDITNDSDFTTNAIAQKFATQDSMAAPDFDGMTPLQTFTWSVSDTTYRAVYQMENTGWAYDNMDVSVAYRITVTGTSISQVVDVYERWYSPTNYPITSAMCRTLSTSAATTGFRYLRAVYPTSSGLNNNTYKIGSEISNYNTTARTIKVEVFKTATGVTWNATKPSGSIYTSSTYQANNAVQTYSTRGWIFRKAASFQANGADVASFVNSYEPWSMSSSTLKAGAALTNGYLGYLATDGKVYMVTNTTQNMVPTDAGKIGLITTGYNANDTIDYRYFRPLAAMSSTQVGYISHDTFTLGYPVYLRCTRDSSGNIHSGNYLTTSMAAGYTYVPIGVATATNAVALDARKPMFYTLDSSGKLSHVNGKAVAGTTYTAGAHINITGSTIKAIDYVHSDTPVSTSSVTPIVTNSMISDGTITFSKTATGEFLKLTLTTTDPGAGSALAANTLLGVYE